MLRVAYEVADAVVGVIVVVGTHSVVVGDVDVVGAVATAGQVNFVTVAVALDDDGPLLHGHWSIYEDGSRHVYDLWTHDDALARHEHRSYHGHVDVARYVDGLLRGLRRFGHEEDGLHGL